MPYFHYVTRQCFLIPYILVIFIFLFYSCTEDPVSSCNDGVQNGTEIGIDCGGDCEACSVAGNWSEIAKFPGGVRTVAISFSVGGKGYVGAGYGRNSTNSELNFQGDLWVYDPSSNAWTALNNFPGGRRGATFHFIIDDIVYVGMGQSLEAKYNDLWAYDVNSDSWTLVNNGQIPSKSHASGFSLNGKGYIVCGLIQGSGYTNQVYEFDPHTNEWTRKSDFPGARRWAGEAFVINGEAYYGLGGAGLSASAYFDDFWKYIPSSDTWIQMSDFPGGPRWLGISFVINNKAYVGLGQFRESPQSEEIYYNDMWEYKPNTDQWMQIDDFSGGKRSASAVFVFDQNVYIGLGTAPDAEGSDTQSQSIDDFWTIPLE